MIKLPRDWLPGVVFVVVDVVVINRQVNPARDCLSNYYVKYSLSQRGLACRRFVVVDVVVVNRQVNPARDCQRGLAGRVVGVVVVVRVVVVVDPLQVLY